MSEHSGIQIEALFTLCFLKPLKSRILVVHITHVCVLMDVLGVRMAWYAAYRKFSTQVKALPKLMLYENMTLTEWS